MDNDGIAFGDGMKYFNPSRRAARPLAVRQIGDADCALSEAKKCPWGATGLQP